MDTLAAERGYDPDRPLSTPGEQHAWATEFANEQIREFTEFEKKACDFELLEDQALLTKLEIHECGKDVLECIHFITTEMKKGAQLFLMQRIILKKVYDVIGLVGICLNDKDLMDAEICELRANLRAMRRLLALYEQRLTYITSTYDQSDDEC
jgi:hypothetical protein